MLQTINQYYATSLTIYITLKWIHQPYNLTQSLTSDQSKTETLQTIEHDLPQMQGVVPSLDNPTVHRRENRPKLLVILCVRNRGFRRRKISPWAARVSQKNLTGKRLSWEKRAEKRAFPFGGRRPNANRAPFATEVHTF